MPNTHFCHLKLDVQHFAQDHSGHPHKNGYSSCSSQQCGPLSSKEHKAGRTAVIRAGVLPVSLPSPCGCMQLDRLPIHVHRAGQLWAGPNLAPLKCCLDALTLPLVKLCHHHKHIYMLQ